MIGSFQNKLEHGRKKGTLIHLFQSVSLYQITLGSIHLDAA